VSSAANQRTAFVIELLYIYTKTHYSTGGLILIKDSFIIIIIIIVHQKISSIRFGLYWPRNAILGSLSKQRRRQQGERHQTKGLMSKQ